MDDSLMLHGAVRTKAINKRLGLFLRETGRSIDCDASRILTGSGMPFQTVQVMFLMQSSTEFVLTMNVRADHSVGAIRVAVNSDTPHSLTPDQLHECGAVLGAICALFYERPVSGGSTHDDMRPEIRLCPEFEPRYRLYGYDLASILEMVANDMGVFGRRMGVLRFDSDDTISAKASLIATINAMCQGW